MDKKILAHKLYCAVIKKKLAVDTYYGQKNT